MCGRVLMLALHDLHVNDVLLLADMRHAANRLSSVLNLCANVGQFGADMRHAHMRQNLRERANVLDLYPRIGGILFRIERPAIVV